MAKKYVPEGVFLACNEGTSVSTLRVTNNCGVSIYGVPEATEADKEAFFNIKPMGLCKAKLYTGCLPMVPQWDNPKDGVTINGNRKLLEDSTCQCMLGGKITIHFTRESAVAASAGNGKMPTDYIKGGFDWLFDQSKQARAERDKHLPEWMQSVAHVGDWFEDASVSLVEGAVNGVVGLGETIYQVAQDPVGTAEALGGMASDAYDWASDWDNWKKTGSDAWDWTSKQSLSTAWEGTKNAAEWVKDNPRKIGNTVGEFIPDAAAAYFTAGGSTAVSGAKKLAKEGLEEAVEKGAKEGLEEAVEKGAKEGLEEAAETGAKKTGKELLKDLADEAGDIPKVVTKTADEIAEELWKKFGYDDLGKHPPCFLAGTLVKTPLGDIEIEKLKKGDKVFVYDFAQDCLTERPISKLYTNWTNRYFKIGTKSQDEILVTRRHLFWVESEKKWIPAKELEPGMFLKDVNNETDSITEIVEIREADVPTYNLEIEDIHNYFVGRHGLLVHNQNESSKFTDPTKKDVKIYEVYDPKTGKTVYVGQTDKPSVEDRFEEHLKDKDTKKADKSKWEEKGYKVREVDRGNWTQYEASVWEQHYIEKNGGVDNLQNGRREITKEKFDKYKDLHQPC